MRKLDLFVCFLFFVPLVGCKTFPTVKPSVEFEKELNVNNSTVNFSGQDFFDAGADADFEKYKNKVNSVDVERITYTILESTGSASTLVSGQLEVADSKGGNRATLTTLTNVNFANSLNRETDITAGTAALETLENALSTAPFQANLYYSGVADKGPVRLRLKLKFYTKVTARIIGSN